ncbi:MAG: hypothetical protein BMS9Abin10_0142 [Gammaproteobacteria bacterium]|nr:MAG: hypothetical protein BMS9Abin10_0142 [Gammaproteobacteria bacterium]
MDINRPVIGPTVEDRLRCEDNFALRLAEAQRLEPIERRNPFNLPRLNILSALLCEDEGFYHIDMRPLRFGR